MPMWDELDQNLGGEIGLLGSQTDTRAQTEFACRSRMYQIKIWEAKLDYLVVRQTHEQKCGSGWREWEGSAQIQVFMPQQDESD
jgi:hypothetical protein